MDYTIFYKVSYENGNIDSSVNYDYFFSAFDGCDRTTQIFEKISSKIKYWINFPHYHNNDGLDNCYTNASFKEDDFFLNLFNELELGSDSKICIDITGFIRPHLIFFINYIYRVGIKKIDFLYSEPLYYKKAEDTMFSGIVDEVRIIEGCGSEINISNTENDILIIPSGYDTNLITKVSTDKSKISKKYYILGFPSLQPDMYQENVLKMFEAKDSIGRRYDRLAPAFDPFTTAQVISDIVKENPNHSNIYLSPLSTKPQTLGVVLYYLWNYDSKAINIIFPFSKRYYLKTSVGLKKTWQYTFELP